MVKDHLKRIACPKTWDIKRKKNTFIIRPEPSGHTLRESISITSLFRDILNKVKTMKEMKYILHNKEVLLNTKRVTSHKASVGVMDIVFIPQTNEIYRVLLNDKGVITAVQITDKEKNILPVKIKNKTVIVGGKIQLNFTNGRNLILDKDNYNAGDVLLLDLVTSKVKEHLKLEKDSLVYLLGGKFIGTTAIVDEIKKDSIIFKIGEETVVVDKRTSKDSLFVIGKGNKPSIKLVD